MSYNALACAFCGSHNGQTYFASAEILGGEKKSGIKYNSIHPENCIISNFSPVRTTSAK